MDTRAKPAYGIIEIVTADSAAGHYAASAYVSER
jgi:hypothetical protein